MTIFSLNVWGGRKLDSLLGLLAAHTASVDVFCLQEVYSRTVAADHPKQMELVSDLAEQLATVLPGHELLLAPSRDSWGEQLAVFVRRTIPIIKTRSCKLVTTSAAERRSSGSVYLATCALTTTAGPLRIGTLHGYWEKDEGEDKPPRDEQIANLLTWIDEETTPVVLCGDFNMNRHSRGIERLSQRLTNLIRTHRVPTTRPAWNAYAGTVADYCFVSPELTVRRFAVLPDDVSDHLALLLDIAD